MTWKSPKFTQLYYVSIFSGLALSSYYLLINFTALPQNTKVNWFSYQAMIYFIFAFNILGFTILHANAWVNRRSPLFFTQRPRVIMHLGIIAGLLFFVNYGLVVIAKLLAGAPHLLTLKTEGIRIFLIVSFIELIVVSLLVANETFRYTLNLYKQASHLSEESNKARFIALQNQLNPHFLFNSLNTLVSEIEYNPKNAVAFTTHLSDVYRYILLVQDKTLVSLKDEMEFLESFLFLHQVRLGDCIHRDIIFNDELYERKLPPLTLQLLAENVVKHNSISMRSPMTISIRYNQETKVLEFSNRVNPRKGIPSSGRGLQNLNGRYQLIAQQEIEIREENGFFKVSIPLLYE